MKTLFLRTTVLLIGALILVSCAATETEEIAAESSTTATNASEDAVEAECMDEVLKQATEASVPADASEAPNATGSNNADDTEDNKLEDSDKTDEFNKTDDTEPSKADETESNKVEEGEEKKEATETEKKEEALPLQTGPFIDILGETLLSLEMINETSAQFHSHLTNEALNGKKVVGLYFSADWCGPCRQFTPDLVNFYNKMNARKGKENQFEIVWISRCRDVNSYGQYFTHMNWLAMTPEDAMGAKGEQLSQKYKVKGIPHLVLLDDMGSVITYDGRTKIPADKAGIGFPWRNPLTTAYITLVPKSLRMILKTHLDGAKQKIAMVTGLKAKMA
eukprot:CAMPEP_0195519620 /NCGR_PEP_ID=MMETSP0794_2-20130614/15143_1 /TAXON_ID=515487 /ORGANISM="Stephanopyxis turris, Strain CCMP 815" /LENGTH=334 /DNA_ID=CAMNT_0040648803 /DNA_START=59 /DNA_END=1063 /DNA_ORIENTATION=+